MTHRYDDHIVRWLFEQRMDAVFSGVLYQLRPWYEEQLLKGDGSKTALGKFLTSEVAKVWPD